MDTTTIRVNGVCNASCSFCELSGAGALDDEAWAAALAQLERDRGEGVTRLRLGGGEPMLEPRLVELVSSAREMGFEAVILETNGILAGGEGRAALLVEAGLTDVLWAINGADGAANEAVFQLSGAHGVSVAGARAFVEAGASVVARTPLVASALPHLASMPAWLRENVPGLSGWWLRPLVRDPASRFDAALIPPLLDLGASLRMAAREARLADLPITIEDDVGLPLCLLSGNAHALAALQRHPNRDRSRSHQKVDACMECVAGSECPGQPSAYADQHGLWPVAPLRRIPQALVARSSRPEQYVIYDQTIEEGAQLRGPQVTIRVIMPCNQDCTFCFVDRTSPGLDDEAIFSAIDEAAERGASRVSLSGGEPTLHRLLPEFVARARERGVGEREIQTNALLLAEGDLAQRLVAAGLNQAVVSLHAVDPERYHAITGAGLPTTVMAGVRNLLDLGVRVELNIVHNHDNLDHLTDVVEAVAARIPEAQVLFSVTYIVSGLPRDWDNVAVRYADAVPHLVQAMRSARSHGLRHRMTGRCGTPPCSWQGHLADLHAFKLLTMTSIEPEEGHRYIDACQGCAARGHCYGINTAYLERFGDAEFAAIAPADWDAARESAQ